MSTTLRRWLYLDDEGIRALHGQIVRDRVVETSRTTSKSNDSKLKGGARAGALGVGAEVGGERSSAQRYEIYEKTAPADEQMLLKVEEHLAISDSLCRIASARDIAEIYAKGASEYVTGILSFNWSSTHDVNAFEDAVQKQMVEFSMDRESDDGAGMLAVPVVMAGSLSKCLDKKNLKDGSLSPTSHLAVFLRQLRPGRALRLGFVAQLNPWSELIYLKPYGIWFP